MIVLALLIAALSAQTGSVVYVAILIHSTENTSILVQNTTHYITEGTNKIRVPLTVEKGVHEQRIQIEEHNVMYELPITITGEKQYQWLWWLSTIPLVLLTVFIVKKKHAGSS